MLAVLLLNRMSTQRRLFSKKRAASGQIGEQKTADSTYCRTCLNTEDLVAIFYNKDTEEKMAQDFKLVTGLEIKMNDGLSQKICTKCLDTFNLTLQFRRTCRRAEKTILAMFAGSVRKKKHIGLKYSIEVKPKYKKEKEEVQDYSYEDAAFGDDFQNDHDFDCSDDVKPVIRQKPGAARKKRTAVPNAASYKCATCSKEFRMKATYKAHMRFHTNYCVCESCGKRCRNNNQLQEHKRARHGLGRIHKCAYCEYSSATKEALTIHERRHTGERPYICDHCGATFHRRSNLVQHIAIHLPEKNFQCDMCPKKLKSKKFLQIHKHNAHTGKRYGYLCAVCAHRFEKPNKVRAHMRRVHGIPDEQQGPIARCTFCPIREKSKKRLQIHISKQHKVKKYSYKCPRCFKLFQRNEHVHRHLLRIHRVAREQHPPIERVDVGCDKDSHRPMAYCHVDQDMPRLN